MALKTQDWAWVQPANHADLLDRLRLARDLAVPERERENLCACAATTIKKLLGLLDERENLLQEFVEDTAYPTVPLGPSRDCQQCGTPKGAKHLLSCVVGRTEALLRAGKV